MKVSITTDDFDIAIKERLNPVAVALRKMFPGRSCAVGVYSITAGGKTYNMPDDMREWLQEWYKSSQNTQVEFELV